MFCEAFSIYCDLSFPWPYPNSCPCRFSFSWSTSHSMLEEIFLLSFRSRHLRVFCSIPILDIHIAFAWISSEEVSMNFIELVCIFSNSVFNMMFEVRILFHLFKNLDFEKLFSIQGLHWMVEIIIFNFNYFYSIKKLLSCFEIILIYHLWLIENVRRWNFISWESIFNFSEQVILVNSIFHWSRLIP